jgi:acyl-coenzyme A synthetase/AMP-(fatty) acid ligase
VRRPDPVMFLGYWNNPEATRAKFAGDWCLTGDVAVKDGDGYTWYKGREDDLISSGGYRIGPTDIEDCLMKHPAVLIAAVVGSPDPVHGEIVKAFVVAKPEVSTGSGRTDPHLRRGSSGPLSDAAGDCLPPGAAAYCHRKNHAPRVASATRSRQGLK